jgi:hypothetical protein
MGEAFHLVCHDCTEEGVYDDRGAAESALECHRRDVDHRMSLLDIAAPHVDTCEVDSAP